MSARTHASETGPDTPRQRVLRQYAWSEFKSGRPGVGQGIPLCLRCGNTMKKNGTTSSGRIRCPTDARLCKDSVCGFLTCRTDFWATVRIPVMPCGFSARRTVFDKSCGFSMECADFSTCHVDSEQAVRILNNVCGFWAGRADFRQVVRIARGPKPAGNRPFRAKTADSEPITAENPPDESAQVPKNPHDRLRIRTTDPESA